MNEKAKIGEILVAAGVIDRMQLAAALGEQARWGRRLGVTLIKMGMVEEGNLTRALAKQLSMPVASLAGKRIPGEVLALVPARVAAEHAVIPLFTKKVGHITQLFLGMEDPSNLAVLDDLSFRTGMEIHPVMVGPTEIGETMDRYYLTGAGAAAEAATRSHGVKPDDIVGERNLRVVTDEEMPPTVPVPAPPVSSFNEIELSDPKTDLPEGLMDDVASALAETDKTRIVAKAIAQLLIEKGIISLAELQARIARLKGGGLS